MLQTQHLSPSDTSFCVYFVLPSLVIFHFCASYFFIVLLISLSCFLIYVIVYNIIRVCLLFTLMSWQTARSPSPC